MTFPLKIQDYFGREIMIGDRVLYVTNTSGCMEYGQVMEYYEAGVGYRAQYKGVKVKVRRLNDDHTPAMKMIWNGEKHEFSDTREATPATVEFGPGKFYVVD